jgi:ABC-type lipoprotein export system ATPase subunit
LLADEPTGALDHANAERLAELLAEMNAKEKVAIVMVTHAASLARRMARVMELKEGKLVAA